MLTIAWPATFNVVSFSLLLVQYPKVDTSSLFYFGVCDNFSPSSLLGANTYTSNVAIFSPLSWLEHRQKHLTWSVFLYSWCNTQRWTLLLYSTLVYVTAFLHLYYFEPTLIHLMWLLFSIVMARAQAEVFNVVSFSLFLMYNPKVDTSSLFYFGICAAFLYLYYFEPTLIHLMWLLFLH